MSGSVVSARCLIANSLLLLYQACALLLESSKQDQLLSSMYTKRTRSTHDFVNNSSYFAHAWALFRFRKQIVKYFDPPKSGPNILLAQDMPKSFRDSFHIRYLAKTVVPSATSDLLSLCCSLHAFCINFPGYPLAVRSLTTRSSSLLPRFVLDGRLLARCI